MTKATARESSRGSFTRSRCTRSQVFAHSHSPTTDSLPLSRKAVIVAVSLGSVATVSVVVWLMS